MGLAPASLVDLSLPARGGGITRVSRRANGITSATPNPVALADPGLNGGACAATFSGQK